MGRRMPKMVPQVGRGGRPPVGPEEAALLSKHASITHALKDPSRALAALNKDIGESSLIDFSELMWSVIEPGRPFVRGWAIEAICEHLEAVTRGEIKKLLMNVPPGLMKSLSTNVFWPAWEWGPKNLPWLRYISAAYTDPLTIRDNRRCRQLMQSDLYQALWGDRFQFSSDQDSKTRYDNDHRGFRIATSVGGLSTGERGDRFIIDDPHNVKTAESDAKLDEVAQWLTEVVPSRVNDLEESAFIVIMQRVHERDASGVLLAADLGYVHLELPMEFEESRRCHTVIGFTDPRKEEGELLFPERFTAKGVAGLKKALSSWGGEYAVSGQLQQRPVPRGGGMFKIDDVVTYVDAAPPGGRVVRGWDIAGSKRKTSPFTASAKLKEVGGTYYILDVTRERKEIEDAEAHIETTARNDGVGIKQSLPQDPGSAGKSQKAHMGKALDGLDFEITPESGSKEDRAIGIASQWNNGNVKVVKGPWNAAFIAELRMFPRGMYKDQVDALSRAYGYLVLKPNKGAPSGPQSIDVEEGVDVEEYDEP